jgi:uncharacterized protein (DUF1330 family)
MVAFGIFIRERTTDAAALAEYGPLARVSMAGHPIKPLVLYGAFEVVEGAPAEGVVVIEFPSMAEAKAWYDSPAYQAAREQRFKGAEYRALIVEGL